MDIYLTSGDTARMLGLSQAGLSLLVARKQLPVAARTESGLRLFRREDVERLSRDLVRRPRRARWYDRQPDADDPGVLA